MISFPGPDPADQRSNRTRMQAGEWYVTDAEILAVRAERAELMDAFNASRSSDPGRRRELLEALLGTVGVDVEVRPPVYVDYGNHVSLGAGTFLNFGCQLADVAEIVLGEAVQVGPYVQFLTPIHPVDPVARRDRWERAAPIRVEDNVWIGGGAIVLPGVTIGADTVVGAGAVVTKDLPPRVLAVGNPARLVRQVR